MDAKTVGKVGIGVVVGIIALILSYSYFAHLGLSANSYLVNAIFDNTQGLQRGSFVRMQGVQIGEVQSVELHTELRPPRSVVKMAIDRKYHIPFDAKFTVVSGLLIAQPQVEIRPDPTSKDPASLSEDGRAEVTGEPPTGTLAGISPELQQLVVGLNQNVGDLTKRLALASTKLNTLLDSAQGLVKTASATIGNVQTISGDPKIKRSLDTILDNFTQVSSDVRASSTNLSQQLAKFVASGRGKFDKVFNTVLDLEGKLSGTIDDARDIVKKLADQVTDPRLQQSLQETVETARSTLARVSQITSDIHQITGDPTLQANLKDAVGNINTTSRNASSLLERLDNLLARITGAVDKAGGSISRPRISLPKVTLLGNVSEQLDPTRLRVDADARVALSNRRLLDLGLYDLGQDTRLNLQLGDYMRPNLLLRYGLYASKIGAGLEYTTPSGTGIRADLWDTSRLRLDLKGLVGVNKNASIWIGGDNLLRRPYPIIGIQIKP